MEFDKQIYWIVSGNAWSKSKYTQKEAKELAKTLINCERCIDCSDCRFCSDCSSCSFCSYSRFCSDCSFCSYCMSCSDCSSCSFCSDFKTNPERIVSPIIGSRDARTTIYWTSELEQVVCGCFRGNLAQFEKAVKQKHGENKHAVNYLKWIEKVKQYRA